MNLSSSRILLLTPTTDANNMRNYIMRRWINITCNVIFGTLLKYYTHLLIYFKYFILKNVQ